MTKKEMFTAIRTVVADNAEMVAFIDREIELLNRKSASPKKPTARQLENENLKTEIFCFLSSADAPKCIKEIQSGVAVIAEMGDAMSNQRMSHLLKDMVDAKTIVKTYVKKTPYYSVA